jgi:RecA-family ATPase
MPADSSCPIQPALHPAASLLDGEIRPPEFVIPPFFPCGELTEIVGAHGNLKSTIALDACLAVASGRPWGGVATQQGRSVFITLEDAASTLARRTRAWLRGIFEPSVLAVTERDVRANFRFLAREDAHGLVLTQTCDGVTTARRDVADALARATEGASFVVLETVSRLHDGPETNEAFASLVRALERVAANGAAVVAVHHMSKKGSREMLTPDDVDSHAGRGGGALSDAARSVLVVTRKPGDPLAPVALTLTKATHARMGATVYWGPVVVEDLNSVRLEHLMPIQVLEADAEKVAEYLAAAGERGVSRSAIHKTPPPGVSRDRAFRALDALVSCGRVVRESKIRGRNKARAEVYFAAGVVR